MYIIKKIGFDVYVKIPKPESNTFITTDQKHEAMPFPNKPVYVLKQYDTEKEFEIVKY